MPFTLVGPRRPSTLDALTAIERAQLELLGKRRDGSPTIDLDVVEGWQVVDPTGTAHLDLWVTGIDCGGVLRAGTTEVVGDIVQFGFACNDLDAWQALASATIPEASRLAEMDLTLPLDTTLELCAVAPSTIAAIVADPEAPLSVARVSLDAAWRGLGLIVSPYDDAAGSLRELLLGASRARLPGVTMPFGAPGYYDAERVRTLDALLATVPNAAVTAAALALASLDDAGSWTTDDYLLRLDRLRKFVAAARAANASLLTAVQ